MKCQNIRDKEKTLKVPRMEKTGQFKESGIRMAPDFSAEALETGRQWSKAFRILSENYLWLRNLNPNH